MKLIDLRKIKIVKNLFWHKSVDFMEIYFTLRVISKQQLSNISLLLVM